MQLPTYMATHRCQYFVLITSVEEVYRFSYREYRNIIEEGIKRT